MSIPNPARGEYGINLDKSRVLKYDLNAFVLFEETVGRPLDQAFDEGTPKLADLRALIWCGLVHEDRSLSLEEAGGLIEYGFGDAYSDKLKWILEECANAFKMCWPDDKSKKKPTAQESKNST
jgi:hypothetical protein